MMVMEEFQKVYTVASIYRGIFAMAIQQICPEAVGEITGASAAPASAPGPAPGVAAPPSDQNQSTGITTGNPIVNNVDLDPNVDVTSMVDALLDESSTLNFWETWNQMWVE